MRSVIVDPIDVNGDGTLSDNLFDELDCYQNAWMTWTFEIKGDMWSPKGGIEWRAIFYTLQSGLMSWDCQPGASNGTKQIEVLSNNSFRIVNQVYIKSGNNLTVENPF